MYAQISFYDARDNLCRKDPDFIRWVDALLRRMKKLMKKEEGSFFYLSEYARALQAQGVILRRI
jgi:hypothetical protein